MIQLTMKLMAKIALFLLIVVMMPISSVHAAEPYLLGPGDAIRVTVFQNPELTLEAKISDTGEISYPLIGTVHLAGLTTVAAERRIAAALQSGGFLIDPQVNILLLQIRGSQVSVLGFVNRPGKYPIEQTSMRVSDVIALAGGVTTDGSDTIRLTGIRDGLPYQKSIDISRVLLGGKLEDDVFVMTDDVIYVPRGALFYIYGEVQRPGAMRIERGMTLRQAIAQAGGLTPKGTLRGLEIHRRNANGEIEVLRRPKMDDIIVDGDVIQVQESWF